MMMMMTMAMMMMMMVISYSYFADYEVGDSSSDIVVDVDTICKDESVAS